LQIQKVKFEHKGFPLKFNLTNVPSSLLNEIEKPNSKIFFDVPNDMTTTIKMIFSPEPFDMNRRIWETFLLIANESISVFLIRMSSLKVPMMTLADPPESHSLCSDKMFLSFGPDCCSSSYSICYKHFFSFVKKNDASEKKREP